MKENNVRTLMKNGIIRLLMKKNFLDITVTDLVKESGIARASFYRVYNSVDQVMDDIAKEIGEDLTTKYVPILISKNEKAIKEVISSFYERVKKNDIPIIEINPENLPFLISKLEQNSFLSKNIQFNNINEKYGLQLYIVLVVSIARLWGFYGYKETIEEITDYTYSLVYKQ